MEKNFRRQQWMMLLATMLCYLFFYTGRHNFGWAAKGMSAALDIPYSAIGWISFSMLMGYAIGQLINGNLADRLSPKRMIITGAYLSVLTNLTVSYADSFYTIMILWALNGYFQSMAWAPGGKLINNWWGSEERGKAFGFYTMSAGLSSAVTFLLSIILIQLHMEWRMLFRIPVVLLFISSTIFLFIAKDKPAGKETGTDGHAHEAAETWQERYRAVFRQKQFLLLCLAFGFESMARYGLILWVPVHYLGQDWKSNPDNLWATLLLPVGMAAGALSFGVISDTVFGKDKVIPIKSGMVISAVLSLMIYYIPFHNLVLGSILMFLAGFFVYGTQSCFWALCPDILGSRYTGTGIGLMNMFGYVFAALGEPILGNLIDVSGNTGYIFIAVSVISLLCVAVLPKNRGIRAQLLSIRE